MRVNLGTSGWQYASWRRRFYPDGLAQRDWLPFYAERFATVEVNNTFYRLPESKTFGDWAARTPDDFEFAVKASRFLSHIKRLKEPDEPIGRFLEAAAPLGKKLGPILVQLPPTMAADLDRLDEALATFGNRARGSRIVLEFRHESWFTDETYALLEKHAAALCLTDRRNTRGPIVCTTDWTFVRLHEGTASPRPCYGRSALESWADTLSGLGRGGRRGGRLREAYVFFNNDPLCCAVANARQFALALDRRGIDTTRVPGAREVTAG